MDSLKALNIILFFNSVILIDGFAPNLIHNPRHALHLSSQITSGEEAFPDAEIIEITMIEHKPLGCTVEEGLGDVDLKPVFISKVTEGGNADLAGLQVGDVVVAVSGMFDQVNDVLGEGIDAVTSVVAARSPDERLVFRIARGTTVLEQHESSLVELCTALSEDEKETEECITNFLTTTYEDYTEEFNPTPSWVDEDTKIEEPEISAVSEEEDMMDDVFNMWNDELDDVIPQKKEAKKKAEEEKKEKFKSKITKPLPWRSRSSPSGTYVRDPKTGKMVNIDR